MRKVRVDRSIVASLVAVAAAAVFLTYYQQTTSGQDEKKKYGAILCCDMPIYVSDKWTGTDRQISCRDYLQKAPEGERHGICQKMQKAGVFKKASCARDYGELCPDEKPNCDKPTPWFDNTGKPGADCGDPQPPAITVEGSWVFLTMCGTSVFAYQVPSATKLDIEAYRLALLEHVKNSVGDRVCCKQFNDAMEAGSACLVNLDLDCDGESNASDKTPDGIFPSIQLWTVSPELRFGDADRLPPFVMNNLQKFVPDAKKCDCKWELQKGTLTCSADGRQPHVYQARWRCPSTGNERFTRIEAPATEVCRDSSAAVLPPGQRQYGLVYPWLTYGETFSYQTPAPRQFLDLRPEPR